MKKCKIVHKDGVNYLLEQLRIVMEPSSTLSRIKIKNSKGHENQAHVLHITDLGNEVQEHLAICPILMVQTRQEVQSAECLLSILLFLEQKNEFQINNSMPPLCQSD